MKRILEINKTPQLTSYVQHSYTNAIIDKQMIASFYVNDLNRNRWEAQRSDILWICNKEADIMHLCEAKGRISASFCMKRKCSVTDEVVVKLVDIKLVDSMSYICLGINENGKIIDKQKSNFWFYWNQYDITTDNGHISYGDHFNLYYRMTRSDNSIQISVSRDMKKWDVLYSSVCKLSASKEYDFYIEIYYGENQYEHWIGTNYVQLFYDENDVNEVYLDYYMFPRKGSDASYQYLCHFLDSEYIDFQQYQKIEGVNIHRFIKNSILQDYYVNICLDEYYISERCAYFSYNYSHYNLFYGFDDKKREYYILGYGANGKLVTSTLPYKIMKKPIYENSIVRYRYRVNQCEYKFQLSYLKDLLWEYLEGGNSSQRYAGLLANRDGIYGIKIFEKLTNTERGKRLLIEDRRISYVLYEHCKLMQSRLSYLNKKGYIHMDNRRELLEKCNLMVKTSEVIKNLVIKNFFYHNYESNIIVNVNKLKEAEIDFLECLVEYLAE